MKKQIVEKIEIPDNVEVFINGAREVIVKIKGPIAEIKRNFGLLVNIKLEKVESGGKEEITIKSEKSTKREKKLIKTIKAHIKNMISGSKEKFVYKLKICHVHFPITASVDSSKRELVIKNFLGENKERKAKILENVDVKIERDIIIVESFDKEAAGQTAANIEKATKIKARDRRIFQDGIFIINKAGKEI